MHDSKFQNSSSSLLKVIKIQKEQESTNYFEEWKRAVKCALDGSNDTSIINDKIISLNQNDNELKTV